MKNRTRMTVQDAGVIGWISISEVFLLCGVTMMVIALAVGSNLDRTTKELVRIKDQGADVVELRAKRSEDEKVIEELKADHLRDAETLGRLEASLRVRASEAAKNAVELAQAAKTLATARAEVVAMREKVEQLEERLAKFDETIVKPLRVKAEMAADERDQGVVALATVRGRVVELEDRLAKVNESIVMPLRAAKLIVKIRCDSLPEGYDLDLYVQDPHNQVCSWVQPRTLWESTETGLLILSEDLRTLPDQVEEIYYSTTIIRSEVAKAYLVSGMLRQKGTALAKPLPADVAIGWEVEMETEGHLKSLGRGVGHIKAAGKVIYARGNYAYDGLVPLTSFARPPGEPAHPLVLAGAEVHRAFRGWSSSNVGTEGTTVIKQRD